MRISKHVLQEVITRAVHTATRRALDNNPVADVIWIPNLNATDDQYGNFVVVPCPTLSGSSTPPWMLR